MVSADNLNLDVLELIFWYLPQKDLPSVALVSRSFFVGALPRLYSNIVYGLRQAKKYPRVKSPFNVIVARPWLATHVRHVELQVVPKVKIERSQYHSDFLSDCSQAVKIAKALISFKCTLSLFPLFLEALQEKERLHDLRINANLTTNQAEMLCNIRNLHSLALDRASWNVMDMLPKWVPNFGSSLTNLVLYMTSDLNGEVLEQALRHLPHLLGLHIVGCPKVDHFTILRLVEHTPLVESLSLTTTETSNAPEFFVPKLSNLKHFALDTRYSTMSSPEPVVLSSILKVFRPAYLSLTSFVIRVPGAKTVGHSFVEQLVKDYGATLRQVSFVDCDLELQSTVHICTHCKNLERLALPVPLKDLLTFTAAIARSKSIRTLVDTGAYGNDHHSLDSRNAGHLMRNVPNLNRIVSDKRVWTRRGSNNIALETVSLHTPTSYWFLPRES
ncbi:hypothetical protein VNI00_002891 [Paramarasmius palmivorus]|uniref:F-box domain-containing protein n=1 Tax=Paramarasmius palmivorus TaxID=297713 RepID=A0AAW0DYT4_9AGAR